MKKKILSVLTACAMVGALGVGAFAADKPVKEDVDIPGQGYIAAEDEGNGPGPGHMIDIEVPENGFFWYANDDTKQAAPGTFYDIQSAEYELKNNSDTVNLKVTLKSYAPVSTGLTQIQTYETLSNVVVDLVGNLGTSATTDLLNNANAANLNITYPGTLGAGASWTYSFEGEYRETDLPGQSRTSDYVMVLEFEAVSSIG